MGLNGENLKYAAENIKECRKHKTNRFRVLIVSGSDKKGRNLAAILQPAYNATDIKDINGGYEDFSLVFDSTSRRDEVVTKINSAISEYRAAHPDLYNTQQQTTPQTHSVETPAPTENPETEEKTNWKTYLILGMAIAAILIILWPKKKKK